MEFMLSFRPTAYASSLYAFRSPSTRNHLFLITNWLLPAIQGSGFYDYLCQRSDALSNLFNIVVFFHPPFHI
jgi:hypothetical protein